MTADEMGRLLHEVDQALTTAYDMLASAGPSRGALGLAVGEVLRPHVPAARMRLHAFDQHAGTVYSEIDLRPVEQRP